MKIKLLDESCKPYRAHKNDSGLDIRLKSDQPLLLKPFTPITVDTGIAIELKSGYEAQIRPRSSLSKRGILVSLGTVDNGYRGEIGVTLTNITQNEQTIQAYERIAQLVISKVVIPQIEYVERLSESERGEDGFGSSGRV